MKREKRKMKEAVSSFKTTRDLLVLLFLFTFSFFFYIANFSFPIAHLLKEVADGT